MQFRHRPDGRAMQPQQPTLNVQSVEPDSGGTEGTVNPGQILGVFRRRWPLILGAAAVAVALTARVVLREPLEYQAAGAIRLVDLRGSVTDGIEPSQRPAPDVRPLLSQTQLLSSRALIGAVVDSEGLRLRPEGGTVSPSLVRDIRIEPAITADTFLLDFGDRTVTVRDGERETSVQYGEPYRTTGISFVVPNNPGVPRTTLFVAPRERTIAWVLGNLHVSPREETDIVDIRYTHHSPDIAQRVVNRLILTFQDANVRAAQGKSQRRRLFFEAQLKEINAQSARAERALAKFRSQHQAFSSRDKLQSQQASLLALDVRRGELDANRRMFGSLLGKLQAPDSGRTDSELRPLIAVAGLSANPVIGQLYQQLSQYQGARDSLTIGEWRSADSNPDVVRLDQLIAAARQRLVTAVGGHVATLEAQMDALRNLREQTAAAVAALPSTESMEEQLIREADAHRTLATRLSEEHRKALMAETVEVGQVEIVDLAAFPYQPLGRMRGFKLLLGLIVGLTFGTGAALLLDSSTTRVRRRVDLEHQFRVPVLSIIPKIVPAKRPWRHSLSIIVHGNGDQSRGASKQIGTRRPIPAAPLSTAGSEAFRFLRSSLKWNSGSGVTKTLVVSSALSEEGKTTTSSNLAAAVALEGQRALLIDCDFHRARLHRAFRVARDPGLAQVLRGYLPAAAAVRSTFIKGLSLLPAGRDPFANSADLLGTDRMRTLLNELSGEFDFIVLDTPPLLSVADAAAVGPLADGVLLVVRAGLTELRAVDQALHQLESVGARVVGAVLNDARGELRRYDEYYYYSEDYAAVAD